MRKYLTVASLLLVLTITPVLAHDNSGHGNKHESQGECSEDVENHGEFVSCIAQTHPGGAVVSAAAQSDVGKKDEDRDSDDRDDDEDEDASPTPSVSPVVSPNVSPSPTVSPSPSVSPEASASPSVSPSPTVSPSPEGTPNGDQNTIFQAIIDKLNEIIGLLNNLIK